MSGELRIHPVSGNKDLKAFIKVPFNIYKDDPHWVAPLEIERMGVLKAKKNPYFQHAEAQYWIAYKGEDMVGRISAQVDQMALERMDPVTGHIGFFECENNFETAKALFDTAEGWLKDRGMKKVLGPLSHSTNEEVGLLIDGFDEDPRIMMGHARPYYKDFFEKAGYKKAKDVYAYSVDVTQPFPKKVQRLVEYSMRNPDIEIRNINLKDYKNELLMFFDILNDAWADNWGFVGFTAAEVQHVAMEMKPFIKDYQTRVCLYKGVPSAFMVTLPDLNQQLKDLNGKLLPFGWAKLLWRTQTKNPAQVRVPLLGVRKHLQSSPVGGMMVFLLISTIRETIFANGGQKAELSWILEDNTPMRGILDRIDSYIYKTYRIFKKEI